MPAVSSNAGSALSVLGVAKPWRTGFARPSAYEGFETMSIRFSCPNPDCDETFNVRDSLAGRQARCPACGKLLTVPQPPGAEEALSGLEALAEGEAVQESAPPAKEEKPAVPERRRDVQVCPTCGTSYPAGGRCPRCSRRRDRGPSRLEGLNLAKILTVVVGLGLFGLLAGATLWVISQMGETGQTYVESALETKEMAIEVSCKNNLRVIWQELQVFVISEEKFPESLSVLGRSDVLHCPAPDGQKYIYISGQTPRMPSTNVLVYEEKPAHDGFCSVLMLKGQIQMLTPQQVQAAVAQTHRVIERSR